MVPRSRTRKKIAIAMPTSPIAFITNAFLAASTGGLPARASSRSAGRTRGRPGPSRPAAAEVAGHHQQAASRTGTGPGRRRSAPLLEVAVHVADRVHDDQRARLRTRSASRPPRAGSTWIDSGTWRRLVEPRPGVERVDVAARACSHLARAPEKNTAAAATNGPSDDGRCRSQQRLASRSACRPAPARRTGERQRTDRARRAFPLGAHQCRSAVSRSTSSSAPAARHRHRPARGRPRPRRRRSPIDERGDHLPLCSPQ